ncbi:MAG: thioesterase family protein [Chloroflexi bacterium]|nr:thioesterase family protein [Chloroflexota bacterium]
MGTLQAGLTGRIERVVTEAITARHMGSGSVPVLATPMLILAMEEASHRAVEPCLPPGQSTVGTQVNIRHLAATPLGQTFRAEAELVEIDGRRLRFRVVAFDAIEKIGEGEHERFIIDVGKFAERLRRKQDAAPA